eukprot:gb/GECG01005364.1/.p1 GENE.gb/GECG01005364.1/~~gb/GECG01005364.1/.p1  ORF type:complete len:136 (+),score=2.57 gb/GECG01005364.1/:1-408(+)
MYPLAGSATPQNRYKCELVYNPFKQHRCSWIEGKPKRACGAAPSGRFSQSAHRFSPWIYTFAEREWSFVFLGRAAIGLARLAGLDRNVYLKWSFAHSFQSDTVKSQGSSAAVDSTASDKTANCSIYSCGTPHLSI